MSANADHKATHAGAVVYRGHPAAPKFLLVQASKNPGEWVLPKGHIEPGETAPAAAIREVFEEAGVTIALAEDDPRLGLSSYQAGSEAVHALFFLGRRIAETQSRENRAKIWLPADEAEATLAHEELRSMLRRAKDKLKELSSGPDMRP